MGLDADQFYNRSGAPVFPGQCKYCGCRFRRGEIAYVVKKVMTCKDHAQGEEFEVPREHPYYK